jgi:hypothetical protein
MRKIQLTNNKYAEISILNSRQLLLKTNAEYPDITKTNVTITGLNYYNTFSINLTDTIQIENTGKTYNYTINYIDEVGAGIFQLTEEYRNSSSMFLFPLITVPKTISSQYYYTPYYYNSYIDCLQYPQYNNEKHLFVTYKFFNHSFYKKFENEIQIHKNLVDTQDITIDKVLFVFSIPQQYLSCIESFKNGEYLKFPKEAIHTIIDFYRDRTDEITVDILKNLPERRKQMETNLGCSIPIYVPTWSKPILTNETLIFKL